jgi:hypothetical protein
MDSLKASFLCIIDSWVRVHGKEEEEEEEGELAGETRKVNIWQ